MGVLQYLTSLGIIAPIIVGIVFFKRLIDNIAKPFLFFLIAIFCFESIGIFLGCHSINNHIVYNIIDLLTIVFFTYTNFQIKPNISTMLSAFIFLICTLNFILNDPFQFKYINYLFIYLFIGTYTAIILFQSITLPHIDFFEGFRFWFLSGYIFSSFSSVSMFIFMERINRIESSSQLVQYHSYFNFVITTMSYISFSKAFSCKR